MKRLLVLLLLFSSCTYLDEKATIRSNDFKGVSKENHIKIINKELSKYRYENIVEFQDILNNMYKDDEKLNGKFNNSGLINEILLKFNRNENLRNLINKVSHNNEIIYLYDAFVRAILNSPYEVYNSTWNSKTIKHTYMADELFIHILDDKEDVKDILNDMKIKFSDYPLNKYNEIVNEYNYGNILNLDSKIFKDARVDIRKIDSNFYPELLMYKPRLILSVNFFELIYYALKKDENNLKRLKNEISLSNVDDKINLDIIKELIDLELKSLGG